MKALRPALLVLLTSTLAALGVPAGFAQAKTTPTSAEKRSAASTASARSRQASPTPAKKTGSKATAKATAKPSARTSGKSPAKTTAGKTSGKKSVKASSRSRKQTGQKAPTSDRINEIQAALAREGSYQGTPSGKWDDQTAAAMRKFQAAHGLSPNGKLDAPSLQRLGLGSQTAGVAAPTPPPGATSRLTSSNNNPSTNLDSQQHQ